MAVKLHVFLTSMEVSDQCHVAPVLFPGARIGGWTCPRDYGYGYGYGGEEKDDALSGNETLSFSPCGKQNTKPNSTREVNRISIKLLRNCSVVRFGDCRNFIRITRFVGMW